MQQQRARAQQQALKPAAPANVHHMSTSSSSSHDKQRDGTKEDKEASKEQPNVPEPPQPEQQPAVEPSSFYKLSKRLAKKTPRSEAFASANPFKDAQETLDMPPPEIPPTRQPELPSSPHEREHQSGASSYASAEEPESQETNPSSFKRRKGVGHQ